jgi:hypothetical protein
MRCPRKEKGRRRKAQHKTYIMIPSCFYFPLCCRFCTILVYQVEGRNCKRAFVDQGAIIMPSRYWVWCDCDPCVNPTMKYMFVEMSIINCRSMKSNLPGLLWHVIVSFNRCFIICALARLLVPSAHTSNVSVWQCLGCLSKITFAGSSLGRWDWVKCY